MLKFYTKDPAELLQKFKAKLKAKQGQDSIKTWEQVGENFGHTSERWKNKLEFKANVNAGAEKPNLAFTMTSIEKGTQEEQQIVYAYYHGHLLQTFVDHLGEHFTAAYYADTRKK
ncbi:hypothetical protein [Xanthomonas bundabergensis]|uniref:hypothetical protein n=1 Tax=Xanthomonas bundabergensis TaxID=3160842 RepID=UPI0035138F14